MENKQDKIISIICHSLAGVFLLAMLILASFKDLQISQQIGDQNSFFGVLFQKIAEYPQYLMLPICGVIIFYNADTFSKKQSQILFYIFGAVLTIFGWWLFAFASEKTVEIPHMLGFSIFAGVFYGAIGLGLGKLIPKEIMHKLLKWAVFCLIVTAISLLVTQVLKTIWHRMRFRDMLKEGNFDGFTPWYKINPFRGKLDDSYHYTSFPSGHTSASVHIFLFAVLCDVFACKKWVKYTAYSACALFVLLTMFARIVNCAHFLSDVTVATFVTYLIFYVAKRLFFKKGYSFQKQTVQIKE
ncbi:MAG: phosphatase PAP2 family protein [Clostridia bacterium]